MTEEQVSALYDCIVKKVDLKAVVGLFGLSRESVMAEVRRHISTAIADRNWTNLQAALTLGGFFDFPESELHELYLTLLPQDWHREHETIIRHLQDCRLPETVGLIREAIALKPRLEYLAYDDYGAYYKKCLWALKAIGTPEAIALIEECATSSIPALREEAEYRLSKIR